jgi:hypothetical protein
MCLVAGKCVAGGVDVTGVRGTQHVEDVLHREHVLSHMGGNCAQRPQVGILLLHQSPVRRQAVGIGTPLTGYGDIDRGRRDDARDKPADQRNVR